MATHGFLFLPANPIHLFICDDDLPPENRILSAQSGGRVSAESPEY